LVVPPTDLATERSVALITPPADTPALPAGPARSSRWSFLHGAGFAFLGLHLAALVGVFLVPVTWVGLALFAAFYSIRVFGLTAGYHRYFAHRGYKTGRVFQFLIGCMGASALQRGPMWWAGHHRSHHKHSDTDQDVHSPVTGTLWWSHVGWILSNDYSHTPWDQMKDWEKYPELRLLEKWDLVPGILVAPFCLGVGYLFGGWEYALSALVWGFFVSTVAVYHVTFMVNSVCHLLGTRRFATTDESRNNWWVALLTFGEGWHNNHHHYPSAARQGFKWWEVDISYSILKALSWVGVVWDLRQPTPRALAAKPISQVKA
jgi:stearoyl-CoA desaturase (delta-9 desaturase)